MLNQIELTIKNLPSISFEEYYMQYIEKTECEIIENETRSIIPLLYDRKHVAKTERSIEALLKGVESLL